MTRLALVLAIVVFGGAAAGAAPRIDPELAARLDAAAAAAPFGVILTFHGDAVSDADVASLEAVGITMGVRMANFPIIGVNATPAQIRAMAAWTSLRSIYLNAPLELQLDQTKPLIGVTRLRTDAALTRLNGGLPISGRGVTIAINDSGVDGTHPDLAFNPLDPTSTTIQNVVVSMNDKDGLIVRSDSLGNVMEGILPPVYLENVANTDTHVGHGTHVAGIAAGTGTGSGSRYQGVAPGARVLGLGSGGILFVLGQVAAFDYVYTNQFRYNIRVVNNSWGNSAVAADPEHPVNVASRRLHEEAHIAVVYANGNDGPRPNSQNRWASLPWVITAGASTKDGRLAGFSSRGIIGDPVIHPTVLTPGTGSPTAPYTTDVIAARARTNVVATGADADLQIPPAFVAQYTQISGTSMAAPHLAGIVANVLEANPSLLPDDVRGIVEKTATPLATYDEFEVGTGLANVHAAVDFAFNPAKPYGNFGFAGKGLALQAQDGGATDGSVAPGTSRSHTFMIPANARFTFVQLDWNGAAGEDELVVDNTNVVMNDLALTIFRDGVQVARSNATNLAALFGAREALKLEFPAGGSYTATVNAGISGAGVVVNQPYRLSVMHYVFDPAQISDIGALEPGDQMNIQRLVYDRLLAADGGSFRPLDPLTRLELARAVMLGARVPQFIPSAASFSDVPAGTPASLFAESLRGEGVMGMGAAMFEPGAQVSRLEQAVALVRALRLDAEARALANTTITYQGTALTDSAEVPGALRGYVQIAIDRGVMEAFPAEIRQIAPGRFVAIPGPRFEPGRVVTRAEAAKPLLRVTALMFGE